MGLPFGNRPFSHPGSSSERRSVSVKGSFGTGFLLAPQVALTCYHVLPGPDTAKESSFELDYYEDENGTFGRVTSVQLQPEACFMADRELDFTIVALGTCRVFGDCRRGDRLDRELGDLIGSVGPLERQQKLFRYARYNAELSREGLDLLDCRDIEPEVVQKMDSIDGIPELKKVGRQVAKKKVELADFEGFPAV